METSSLSKMLAGAMVLSAVIVGGAFVAGKHLESKTALKTSSTNYSQITVSGEGKISASPDIAQLTFGVQTGPQKTAQAAMEMLKKDMNAAFAAAKAQGVDEKDIRTESFSLSPSYDWNDGTQKLRGYEANQTLRVKVRDLEKMSGILTAVTEAGANQAGGIEFTIDDQDALMTQARTIAIGKAKAQAETLAKELGVRLVKITGFNEGGGYIPPMPYATRTANMEMGMGGAAMDVALPAGQQDITVNVSLTYEISK